MNEQKPTPILSLMSKGFKHNKTAALYSVYMTAFILMQIHLYGKMTLIPESFQIFMIGVFTVLNSMLFIIFLGTEAEKVEFRNDEEKHFEEMEKEFEEE
ncbi:conserved hypothetical protein [Vibrio crassostreae]|nr:conserved hypothetical protein [Vibrio crassostreae]